MTEATNLAVQAFARGEISSDELRLIVHLDDTLFAAEGLRVARNGALRPGTTTAR